MVIVECHSLYFALQLRISEETKRILQKPSDERIEKELNYVS